MCDQRHIYRAGIITGQHSESRYTGSDAEKAITALAVIKVNDGESDALAAHPGYGNSAYCPAESDRIELAAKRLSLLAQFARRAEAGCTGCPCCTASECAAEGGCDHDTCPCWEGDTGPRPEACILAAA